MPDYTAHGIIARGPARIRRADHRCAPTISDGAARRTRRLLAVPCRVRPAALIESLIAAGWVVALPVVVDKQGPLEYRTWRPGENLISGVWDIPIPEKREIVILTMVLAPLVGFDRSSYRLGYGGGYFDRTLAALRPQPFAIASDTNSSNSKRSTLSPSICRWI